MKYKEWLTPENLILVEGWARDGLTSEQIASNIGISKVTLYEWVKTKPNFANALKKGKEVADYQVENALYKRACGFEYDEVVTEIYEVDGKKKTQVKKVRKTVPPDTGAAVFWLKNRRADRWKDKVVSAQELDIEDWTPILEVLKK